jgi:hypothetical protein
MLCRYSIQDSWWCTYEDLGTQIQAKADLLRTEYFLTGDSLDIFIDSHLSETRLHEIVNELYATVNIARKGGKNAGEQVLQKIEKVLETACVQDLHERGASSFELSTRCCRYLQANPLSTQKLNTRWSTFEPDL